MGRWQKMADSVAKAVRDTFTTDLVFTPRGSATSHSIKGVFNEAFASIQILDGAPIQTVNPAVFVRLIDLPQEPKRGDIFTINGKEYSVETFQRDGEAGAILHLDEIEPEEEEEDEE